MNEIKIISGHIPNCSVAAKAANLTRENAEAMEACVGLLVLEKFGDK